MTDGPEQTHGFDRSTLQGMQGLRRLAQIPATAQHRAVQQGLEYGLEAAESVQDRTHLARSRAAQQPAFAGINTFLKAPYCENIRDVGKYDVAVIGVPFDMGTTYRAGCRFGPQAVRRISALYDSYNARHGRRPRRGAQRSATPATSSSSRRTSRSRSTRSTARSRTRPQQGVFPVVIGGDHSIGYPDVRAIAPHVDGQRRDHPPRPPHRHAGTRHGRAHAHHALVPCDEHPERAAREPRPDRDRRLVRLAARHQGRPRARHHGHHDLATSRSWASRRPWRSRSSGVEGRRGGVPLVRHRLGRRRVRARARAHPSPGVCCPARR